MQWKKKGIHKMKHLKKLIVMIGMAVLATGCEKKDDTIKNEIVSYIEQTNEIADIKNQAITTYNEICSDTKDMGKEELVEYLQTEVVDKLSQYETELAKVSVDTKELEELKASLQQIVAEQKTDVLDTVEALKGYDPNVIDDINLSIEENKKAYEEYMKQLQEYAKEYQVQITEE